MVVICCAVSWLETLAGYDRALLVFVTSALRSAFLDPVMLAASDKWLFALPIVGLAVYRLVTAKRRKEEWLLVVSALLLLAAVDGSATFLKGLIGRPRPCHVLIDVPPLLGCSESFSFPSNHAANAFALATLLARFDGRFSWLWLVLAALVASSRVYVGVHYPSDVVVGALLGVACGLVAAAATRWLRQRRPQASTP